MTQSCEASASPAVVSVALSARVICRDISGNSSGRCSANRARPPTLANTRRGVGNGEVDSRVSLGISSGSSLSSGKIVNIQTILQKTLKYLCLKKRIKFVHQNKVKRILFFSIASSCITGFLILLRLLSSQGKDGSTTQPSISVAFSIFLGVHFFFFFFFTNTPKPLYNTILDRTEIIARSQMLIQD